MSKKQPTSGSAKVAPQAPAKSNAFDVKNYAKNGIT